MQLEKEPWNVTVYMDYVCDMDPWQFEYLCAEALRKTGFQQAGVTPGSGDHGVDVIAIKDGERWAVQCKRYTPPRRVGEDVVKKLYEGAQVWHCTRAAILTTTFYTPQAQFVAPSYGVELWDRFQLYYLLYYSLRDENGVTFLGSK